MMRNQFRLFAALLVLALVVASTANAVLVPYRIETDDRNELYLSTADNVNGALQSGWNWTNTGNIDLTLGTPYNLHVHGREFGGGNWTAASFAAPNGYSFVETGNRFIYTNADSTKQTGRALWSAYYDAAGPYDGSGSVPAGKGWETSGYTVWNPAASSYAPSDAGNPGGNFPTGTRRIWGVGVPADNVSMMFSTQATLQEGIIASGTPEAAIPLVEGLTTHVVHTNTGYGNIDNLGEADAVLGMTPGSSGHYVSEITTVAKAHIETDGHYSGEVGELLPIERGNSSQGQNYAYRLSGYVYVATAGETHTFAVGSDDGFRLKIGDTVVGEDPNGGGVPTPPDTMPVTFPTAGYWPIEVTSWQGGSGVGLEVSHRAGTWTSADWNTNDFKILGTDSNFPVYQRPTGVPPDIGANVGANPATPAWIGSVNTALSDGLRVQVLTKGSSFANIQEAVDFMKANPGAGAIELRSVMDFAGAGGVFSNNTSFPQDGAWNANNFGMYISGLVYVPAPGDYAIGVGTDDGFRLRVSGQTVGEYSGGRGIATTWANYAHVRFPQQGLYPVEFFMNQGGGGYAAEISFGMPPGLIVSSLNPATNGLTPDLTGQVFSVNVIAALNVAPNPTGGKGMAKVEVPALGLTIDPSSWQLQQIIHNGQAKQQGLYAQYYDVSAHSGTSWDDGLPGFQTPVWTANQLTGAGTFNFGNDYGYGPGGSADDLEDQFGARWTGFLDVPQTGNYSFHMSSDDDSWIFIDLDNDGVMDAAPGNDDWHVYWDVFLTEGLHAMELRAREYGGGENSDLDWITPFGNGNWEGVPTDVFALGMYEGSIQTLLYNTTGGFGFGGLEDIPGFSHDPYDVLHLRLTVELGGIQAMAEDFYQSPEPGTMTLLAFGGIGALVRRRRRRKTA